MRDGYTKREVIIGAGIAGLSTAGMAKGSESESTGDEGGIYEGFSKEDKEYVDDVISEIDSNFKFNRNEVEAIRAAGRIGVDYKKLGALIDEHSDRSEDYENQFFYMDKAIAASSGYADSKVAGTKDIGDELDENEVNEMVEAGADMEKDLLNSVSEGNNLESIAGVVLDGGGRDLSKEAEKISATAKQINRISDKREVKHYNGAIREIQMSYGQLSDLFNILGSHYKDEMWIGSDQQEAITGTVETPEDISSNEYEDLEKMTMGLVHTGMSLDSWWGGAEDMLKEEKDNFSFTGIAVRTEGEDQEIKSKLLSENLEEGSRMNALTSLDPDNDRDTDDSNPYSGLSLRVASDGTLLTGPQHEVDPKPMGEVWDWSVNYNPDKGVETDKISKKSSENEGNKNESSSDGQDTSTPTGTPEPTDTPSGRGVKGDGEDGGTGTK